MSIQEIIRKQRMKSDPSFANIQFLERLDELTKEKVEKLIREEFVEIVEDLKADFQKRIEEIIKEIPEIKSKLTKGERGIAGYTPIKGKDYFDGMHGKTPKAGIDFPIPRDGRDADSEYVTSLVLSRIPKPEKLKLDTPDEIVEKVNIAKEKVLQSSIKDLAETFDSLKRAIRQSGGGGGGGGMSLPLHESFSMNGVATSVTLTSNVAAGGNAIIVRYQGQTLDMTTHYTISGKTLSLTFTPENGTTISVTYWRR